MVLQNIVVKPKMCFLYNEKRFVMVRLRIRVLIFMRLTAEWDNIVRLYGLSIPYKCPPLDRHSRTKEVYTVLFKTISKAETPIAFAPVLKDFSLSPIIQRCDTIVILSHFYSKALLLS